MARPERTPEDSSGASSTSTADARLSVGRGRQFASLQDSLELLVYRLGPWSVLTAYLGAALYVLSPYGDRFPAALAGVLTFAAVTAFLPGAKPLGQPILCPLNVALVAFFLQLVIVPLLICFFGPFRGTLPFIPTDANINVAILINAAAFAAFAFGCWVLVSRPPRRSGERCIQQVWTLSKPAILAFAALGVAGMAIFFGSPSTLVSYFSDPGTRLETGGGSLRTVSALVLKPFLGVACVMAWCLWVEGNPNAAPRKTLLVTLAAAAGLILVYATFAYNRGSILAPVVALLAAYGARVQRIPVRAVLIVGLVALLGVTAVRGYRDRTQPDGTISNASALKRVVNNSDFNEELQTYAGGPQFLAFLLEDTHYARDLHHGKTLVSSAMSPVPVVGAPFRPSSGVTFYNKLVYGSADVVDQIIPFQGELFINFHLPGVLLGFFLLGVSIRWLQGRFDRAPTVLQAFAWQYGAIWLAFLVAGGVAGASQVFVFFFWPIYALAAWGGWRRRSLRESVPGGRDADIRGL